MLQHLFPNFLHDENVYRQAERHWVDLWRRLKSESPEDMGWEQPWFQPLPPEVSEGNPIFSAVSYKLKLGIRILQYQPTQNGLEFFAYPDTFGGTMFDPEAIHELVISCALSDRAEFLASTMMKTWMAGEPLSFETRMTQDSSVTRIQPVSSCELLPTFTAA